MKVNPEEEKKRKKAEAQRRRREKIKGNPELYQKERAKEKERWARRVRDGKIKQIKDLSRRQQKSKRRMWQNSSKNYRDKMKQRKNAITQYINDNTPPSSPVSFDARERPGTSRISAGRKRVRKDRAKAYRRIEKLKMKLKKQKREIEKLRKRNQRLRHKYSKTNSPRQNVLSLIRKNPVSAVVKRKLLFHETLMAQLSDNFSGLKSKERKLAGRILTGEIIKRYKFKSRFGFLTYKYQRIHKLRINAKVRRQILEKEVQQFLEKDESSRVCPGKKDTVTKNKIKKQKRLLNKPLKLLHKDFIRSTSKPISYALFCKMKPFWIRQPDVNKRDTCLCTLCENGELLVKKLKQIDIIQENSVYALSKSLCCDDDLKEDCLERKCSKCKQKFINLNQFNNEDLITYHKWCTKTEIVLVSGKEKQCKKTFKNKINSTKEHLVNDLKSTILILMQHIANKKHQYKEMDTLKENLGKNEVILHLDFSENYVCKYEKEIQAFHFGGSKNQVVLHTVMVYIMDGKTLLKKAFCTFSDSARKDPVAVIAHLKPIIDEIKSLCQPTKVHFISDGPSTQYRNFKMFQLFQSYFPNELPETQFMTWNYSEKGHGKGAPDGIGGCIKRMADRLVAHGADVASVNDLVNTIKINVKNITALFVPQDTIQTFSTYLPSNEKDIPRFKGTRQAHQIVWNIRQKHILQFRRLSCFKCCETNPCQHFNIGKLTYTADCILYVYFLFTEYSVNSNYD